MLVKSDHQFALLAYQSSINRFGMGRSKASGRGKGGLNRIFSFLMSFGALAPNLLHILRSKNFGGTLMFEPNNLSIKIGKGFDSKFRLAIASKDSIKICSLGDNVFSIKNSFSIETFLTLVMAYAKLRNKFQIKYKISSELRASIEGCLSKSLSRSDLAKISEDIVFIISLERLLMPLLKHLRPTKVLIIPWYSNFGLALSNTCRRLGIVCGDFQHGVAGLRNQNYKILYDIDFYSYSYIPSTFYLWHGTDSRFLKHMDAEMVSCIFVDNPDFVTSHLAPDKANKIRAMASMSNTVLLISLGNEWLPKLISDSFPLLASDDAFWIIRPHPRKPLQKSLSAKLTNCDNVIVDDHPSPVLAISCCNVHLSESSSLLLETKDLDILNIVIHEDGRRLYDDYIASGRFLYVNDVESLVSLIRNNG